MRGYFEGILGVLHCPEEQAGCDDHAGDEEVDEAISHDIFGVEARYCQCRERPEGLNEIGPSVAPCYRHSCQAWVYGEVGTCGKHHWCLHSPVPAATRHKEVEHSSTQEGEQGIGDRIADADARLCQHTSQTDATESYTRHNSHDSGIEWELQDDSRT